MKFGTGTRGHVWHVGHVIYQTQKCAVLIMRRGRQIKSDGGKIPGSNVIRSLQENDGYKYLGVLQNDEVMEKEMKEGGHKGVQKKG